MHPVTTITLIGIGLYALWLVICLARGVARGEIDPADIDEAVRGWGNIDSDVYDGDWASRDGEIWCDWCHRYHPP
jgi:hypothetical protein